MKRILQQNKQLRFEIFRVVHFAWLQPIEIVGLTIIPPQRINNARQCISIEAV